MIFFQFQSWSFYFEGKFSSFSRKVSLALTLVFIGRFMLFNSLILSCVIEQKKKCVEVGKKK